MCSRLEKRQDIGKRQLQRRLLHAALDGRLGEGALLVLQGDDLLLDGPLRLELVHGHVDGLRETMHAINGLLFDKLSKSPHVSSLFCYVRR